MLGIVVAALRHRRGHDQANTRRFDRAFPAPGGAATQRLAQAACSGWS
jgi:hypothetical protein